MGASAERSAAARGMQALQKPLRRLPDRPLGLRPTCPNRARRTRSLILNAMEHFFTCPYCWQRISFVLDPSVTEQTYVEDCEVCCRPIEVRYVVREGEVSEFEARALE